MGKKLRHWYSDEWCKDGNATTQEQLQNIAAKIKKGCKITEVHTEGFNACTIYENEALGLKYWVKDDFGHIEEIDEARDC